MPSKRHLLLVALVSGALACSEKPKPDPSVLPQPDPGSIATPPVEAPSAKPIDVDRSPIPIRESPEKLTLSATKLDEELLEERDRTWIRDSLLRIHPLRDRMLVTYAGCVAVFNDHRLELGWDMFPPESYEFTAIVGTWPKAVMAQAEFDSWKSPGFQRQAPIKRTEHFRWTGTRWGQRFDSHAGTKAAAWREGSILALGKEKEKQTLAVVTTDDKLTSEGDGRPAAPKQAAPRDPERCKDASTEVVAEELDALPTGEAFVLGKRCGGGGYAMERWAADQAESATDDLPDAPAAAKRAFISVGARDRAHVVLSTGEKVYAARWDGQAFRKMELSDEGDVKAIWTAEGGALFFVLQTKAKSAKKASTELVRVLPSGELRRSSAFALSPSVRVWASDAETAFVTTFGAILSTKPGLVFTKAKKEEQKAVARSTTALPPFTDGCATPFVFLYDVSEKSPPAFDFPATRRALSTYPRVADVALTEFVHSTQRKLGVKVPSAEVGREVMAHVVANMKDERPELTCFAPTEGVRAITLR